MSGWLLDTNVLSELRKEQRCNVGVRQWYEETDHEELFVSVLVLGEIRQGIERIRSRDPAQARALDKWLLWIATEYSDSVFCQWIETVADKWGKIGLAATGSNSRRHFGRNGPRFMILQLSAGMRTDSETPGRRL